MIRGMFTPDNPAHPDFDWSSAKCRRLEVDPSFFFPKFESGPNAVMRLIQESRIRSFCSDCPLRDACFAAASARTERNGFWGGESFESDGRASRTRRRRALLKEAV